MKRCFSIRIDLNISKFLQYAGAVGDFQDKYSEYTCKSENAYMLVNMQER